RNPLFGRYFLDDYSNPAVWDPHNILVTTTTGNVERAQSITLGDSYTLSPSTVNSFHATFSRRRNARASAPQMMGPGDLGITPGNLSPTIANSLQVQITGSVAIAGCSAC